MEKRERVAKSFKTFLGLIIFLLVVSFIFVYSSSSVYALERFGTASYFIQKQLVGLVLGIIIAFVLLFIPSNVVAVASPFLLFIALTLTGFTLVPGLGIKIHGASRWVNLFGFAFQPSELLKYSFIIYVAHVIARYSRHRSTNTRAHVLLLFVVGITSALLLIQPDFGLMVTLCGTALLLWFVAFVNWRYIILLGSTGIPVFAYLIYKEPYRLRRLLAYLDPWQDPQGAGFQVIQSLIAIGSGGFWGVGISYSRQKFFYLPMQHTDFIVSIIAEESGFIGISILILAFILLLYFGMRMAWGFRNLFSVYLVLGYIWLLSLQAIINFCVVAGLFPTKGIGLPFVSYGNSSLVCSLAMLGIIARCVQEEGQVSYSLYPNLQLE
ncbi:cell division protein FtsW [candidate division TM6 bacterium RIFCSPHIGHO2_12_FULL_36_22]|nr:MAG: cell division protein FtsW [candidate division TM6 bacterium RIFCSPHIGHO2_12_FULL_36_22]